MNNIQKTAEVEARIEAIIEEMGHLIRAFGNLQNEAVDLANLLAFDVSERKAA